MNSFTALADPTRRSIVEMLAASGQLSASEISGRFDMSAPAISQHLKVLREAKLVQMEKRAQQRIYSIDAAGLDDMEQWIAQMRRFWNVRLDTLETLLRAGNSKKRKITKPKKET
jgi:DNA-binding transcriptional ArsR family regulator